MPALIDERISPGPLALARVILGCAVLLTAIETAAFSFRLASGEVLTTPIVPLLAPSENSAMAVLLLSLCGGVAIAAGLATKFWAATMVAVEVVTFLSDQQLYSNHRVLLLLLLAFLVFAEADAGWSLRARRRGRSTVPWWPQFLMMCAVSSCYLFAGLSKINPYWFRGTQLDDLRWLSFEGPPLTALAIVTILVEVFIAIGLWLRQTRALAVIAGLGLHLSIVVFMESWFVLTAFALICVGTYPLFLTRSRITSEVATPPHALPAQLPELNP